jgi:hypothetical protein
MQRVVEPEWLDELPPADSRAVTSRRDLRRINWLMGHVGILNRALTRMDRRGLVCDGRDSCVNFAQPVPMMEGRLGTGLLPQIEPRPAPPPGRRRVPQRLVELGAGDGTFLLRLARQRARCWPQVAVVLVDRQPVVGRETEAAISALGWETETVASDVFDWLTRPGGPPADIMMANLFLHHFREKQLVEMFRLAAERTKLFLACEPRRSALALQASRLLGWIGCNDVSRHDAVLSVRAGFAGRELSALWPEKGRWHLQEGPAGLFSHCYVAQRR